MITFTVSPGQTTGNRQRDTAACQWNGQHFEAKAFSATTALARQLVAAGCPDQPWQSFADGQRSLFGRSIHQWAKRTLAEGDRGVRFIPYQDRPFLAQRDED